MANQNQGQNQNSGNGRTGTQNRGFASMSDSDQREIARMGGTAVSGNREHMAQIGRKGGEASAEARASIRKAAQAGKAGASDSAVRNGSSTGSQRTPAGPLTGRDDSKPGDDTRS